MGSVRGVAIALCIVVTLGLGAAAPDARAGSTKSLLADCRDGTLRGSYTARLVRRALETEPAERCAGALRFELLAVPDSGDVICDCAEEGKIDGYYTRAELEQAERDIPPDVDEYTDCRSVIVREGRRVRSVARRARGARRPLSVAKARRYAQRLGDRSARTRTRTRYPRRGGVRAVSVQTHYERTAGADTVRCFLEIRVTRSASTGRVRAKRTRKVCD